MSTDLSLEDVCRVAGYAATRCIEVWYPGRYLWLPRRAAPDHPLALLLGPGTLRALADTYGGERVAVPAASSDEALRRDRRIAEALAAGEFPGDVAVVEGLSVRRVEQIREELKLRGWLAYAAGRRSPPVVMVAPEKFGTGGVAGEGKILERAGSHAG